MRVSIRHLSTHDLGGNPGVDGDGERNCCVTATGLEDGGWNKGKLQKRGGKLSEVLGPRSGIYVHMTGKGILSRPDKCDFHPDLILIPVCILPRSPSRYFPK